MCPQYLWIDTPHAYGRTTLKFRFLMGIFKFSDPMYRGSNIIVHQIQNFPQLLYIKLHLKMSGNINFFQFWVILGHLVPPLLGFEFRCVKRFAFRVCKFPFSLNDERSWEYTKWMCNNMFVLDCCSFLSKVSFVATVLQGPQHKHCQRHNRLEV